MFKFQKNYVVSEERRDFNLKKNLCTPVVCKWFNVFKLIWTIIAASYTPPHFRQSLEPTESPVDRVTSMKLNVIPCWGSSFGVLGLGSTPSLLLLSSSHSLIVVQSVRSQTSLFKNYQIWIFNWLVVLIYGISTPFGSFNAELSHFL